MRHVLDWLPVPMFRTSFAYGAHRHTIHDEPQLEQGVGAGVAGGHHVTIRLDVDGSSCRPDRLVVKVTLPGTGCSVDVRLNASNCWVVFNTVPAGPCAPGAPCGPIGPIGPAGPVAPTTPGAPCGP